MPRKKADFNTVREIALQLPSVEESTTYGSPCFKASGKLLACIAIHRSAEPDTLAVRVDVESRAEMIADDPGVYYLTNHYLNYPFVLVRLKCIQAGALKDLIGTAWRLTTAKPARKLTPKRSAGVVKRRKAQPKPQTH
jgi:hypothetical protein